MKPGFSHFLGTSWNLKIPEPQDITKAWVNSTYLNPLNICVSFSLSLQTISDLEVELSSLREDLQRAHSQHKQQLAEMALLREEEKQRVFLDKEAALDRLRSDMERIRGDLEKSHQQEKDAAQEKVGEQ